MTLTLRPAEEVDVAAVARIWRDGWFDAHDGVVPAALSDLRRSEDFAERTVAHLPATEVAARDGQVLGFCMVHGDELFQLYVAPAGRGSGVAQALVRSAEERMRTAGHPRAWLACACGNLRAARFYEKAGWTHMGEATAALETLQGPFDLVVWRFEKTLND